MKNLSKHNQSSSVFSSDRFRGVRVISFDVFDTLLVRPFLKPTDLFAFMSPEVEQIIGRPIDFRSERMATEYKTRIALPQFQDITIHEIYDHFEIIPEKNREAVKQLELETERQLIYAKRSGQEMYNKAKALGLPLVAISDMYLEESFIREILSGLGFDFKEVYVSSRRRKVKYDGSMFRYVLEDLKLQPAELFHIGDNELYDIIPAERCGIKTFRTDKNSETFFANRENNFLWSAKEREDPSLSAVLGIVANRLFDQSETGFSYDKKSLFNGEAYNLGYYWLGPLLTFFCSELIRTSKDKKVLYFLSRDGWIIKRIYEIIRSNFEHAPEARYLYVSRKSTALAPVRSLENMREKFGIAWFESTVEEWIRDRIGIEIEPGDDTLVKSCGFQDGLASKINLKNSYKFQGVLSVLSPRILAKAKEERALLLPYLSQEGVMRPGAEFGNTDYKIGFVDIGYHGQTPKNIFQLTENYNIDLYFLVAGKEIFGLADEFGITIRGFYGEMHRKTRVLDRDWKKFFRHHKIFETFFITNQGSVKGYKRMEDGKVTPYFYQADSGKEQGIAEAVHAGAIDFATDCAQLFGPSLPKLQPNPNALMKPLLLFADYTEPRDARILEGALFEDFFSGLPLQKVEWFAGWLAKNHPRLTEVRNTSYFFLRKMYAIPSIGRLYDKLYWLALRIYRKVRKVFRLVFVFKNFIPRIF